MPPDKMHADEVDIGVDLAQSLIARQFPQWGSLPVRRVQSAGTDNAIFRIGDELAARMPRIPAAAEQVDKERRWLPKLAPHLPLATPVPIAGGEPDAGYPFRWSICAWCEGEEALSAPVEDPRAAARAVADFITALRAIDTNGGPPPGRHNFYRGCDLALRDRHVRQAIQELGNEVDAARCLDAWQTALATPAHTGPPVWIHGDLAPGNLLVKDGRICAVIDFGGLGVGDPACDLLLAWNYFKGADREAFRNALGVDADAWMRGKGWALSVALIALPYYMRTNPVIVRWAREMIEEVLGEEAALN